MAIVVGYLATTEGDAALAEAESEARRRDERLVVVLSDIADAGPGSDQIADAIRTRLAEQSIRHEIRQMAREADAAADLVSAVNAVKASLLVIGLRNRGPKGKLLLGAKAQRILLEAPCPVLAVKADR